MNYCNQCGNQIQPGNSFCTGCGAPVAQTQTASYQNMSQSGQSYNQQYNYQQYQQQPVVKNDGMAIAGFIVSLVSWFFCCGSLSWLSLIFSIVGLNNIKKQGRAGKGFAIAGIIISSIALVIFILYIVLLVLNFSVIAADPVSTYSV